MHEFALREKRLVVIGQWPWDHGKRQGGDGDDLPPPQQSLPFDLLSIQFVRYHCHRIHEHWNHSISLQRLHCCCWCKRASNPPSFHPWILSLRATRSIFLYKHSERSRRSDEHECDSASSRSPPESADLGTWRRPFRAIPVS